MLIQNYKIIFLILVFCSIAALPQNYQRVIDSPKIFGPTGLYNNIFSGGFNNPEHQFIDIDADNDLDLFFINSDGTFGYLLNTGDSTTPDFKFTDEPIPGLFFRDWFYFVDIDNDNDFDYLTANSNVISLYKNNGSAYSPSFKIFADTLRDNDGNIIFAEFGSNPVLADIDSDNDYDLFLGNTAGTVTFYENIGNAENFSFKFITNFWQNILIIGTEKENKSKHGASSLEFFDFENDGDLDLLWGDFFSNSLYFLLNSGTPTSPQISLFSVVFPINSDSVNTRGFNMPRVADIDGDLDNDLFVSVLYDPTVEQSIIYYLNTGTPQQTILSKQTDDYLYTLDVGNNSHTSFVDIDGDYDVDLLIGSLNNPNGSIWFFENIGNNEQPEFQFITKTFSNITSDLSVVPSFGDLDSDGDLDLLIGRFDGKIEYYQNIGNQSNYNFVSLGFLTDNTSTAIDVGASSTPFLYDFDNDNDLDLICGAFNGRIFFYRNIGNSLNFIFESVLNFFQGIDVGDNSTPTIFDFNNDGKSDLFSGNREGKIFYYKNIGDNFTPIWQLTLFEFENITFGGYAQITFNDIDSDTDPDIFIGNVKGGIYFYKNTFVNSIEINTEKTVENDLIIETFPNPFNSNLQIFLSVNTFGFVSIDVYNILGVKIESIYSGYLDVGKHQFNFNRLNQSPEFSSGTYFIVVRNSEHLRVQKILLLK